MVIRSISQKLKSNIIRKVIKKVFNFYTSRITIYPELLKILKTDKILILAPHADDESIGCGGLLLKYASQCEVLCLTDGRNGDIAIESNLMIDIRKKEFESVMVKLKVKAFRLLGIEDTKLENNYNIFKNIEFENYDYICIPNNLDQHPDHKAVAKHIQKAFLENKISNRVHIIMYEVWNALPLPNFYTDISYITEEKKELINMYHSQIKHIDYAEKILSLNQYRGMIAGKNSIEAYFILDIKSFSSI